MSTPNIPYTIEEIGGELPEAHECPTCGRTHLTRRPNETADLNSAKQRGE